jgi:hypothetical protein
MTTQLHNRVERLLASARGGSRSLILRTVEGEPAAARAQRLADYLRENGHHPVAALPSKCDSDEEWIALCGRGDAQ